MDTKFESKFDFRILGWLLPIAPFCVVPLILFFIKFNEAYSWESLAYYLIPPVFIGLALWVAIRFILEKSPKVIFYQDHLEIDKRRIAFDQIAKIRLFVDSQVLSETSIVILKNGQKFNLGISLYKNGPLIRTNLKKLKEFLQKPENPFPVQVWTESIQHYELMDFGNFRIYKQSIFRNFDTYAIWPLIGLFLFFIIVQPKPATFILTSFILTIFSLLLVFQNYYFLLSDDFLTIKNFYLPGWQKSYRISDIYLIRKFWGFHGADGIELIFSDFTRNVYRSYFLNEIMLQGLIREIRKIHKTKSVK